MSISLLKPQFALSLPIIGLTALAAAVLAPLEHAQAATLNTIYSFCSDQCYDGSGPGNGLVSDKAGNLYGTTSGGGARGGGTVYELVRQADQSFKERVLYNFCNSNCADGSNPAYVRLVIDAVGNLYGTTSGGGKELSGTVFKLAAPKKGKHLWGYSIIYSFCTKDSACSDGTQPLGSLSYAGVTTNTPYDGISPLYGVAQGGGAHHEGVVYSLEPKKDSWSLKVLYAFCASVGCPDGRFPNSVLADSNSDVFGTTSDGGHGRQDGGRHDGNGVLFKLAKDPVSGKWRETLIHKFCSEHGCTDGAHPFDLTMDSAGTLYGTTSKGGMASKPLCYHGCGVAYKITADGAETVLHTFCSQPNCTDGQEPLGGLTLDASGNLFGTTYGGGDFNRGTIFEINGAYQVLQSFCQDSGCGNHPVGNLIFDSSGNLFGITQIGGTQNVGTVFELSP